MSIVIDLIIVAIILVTALISAKQGFVRAVIEVVGFVAAVLVAFSVSAPLADITYEKVIEPPILSSVSENAAQSTAQTADSVWESLPSFITNNSEKLGITKEHIEKIVVDSTLSSADTALNEISQKAVKPVATGILETLYAVILIVVLLFVVKILAKLLNKAFSFSVVGKLNRTLGGLLGVVKGLAIALIVCEIVVLIISFTHNGIWIFNNENIDKTYIFKFLTNVF
ncbi:MAG: CvpA family protein [Clostridia bacterium]|nr:CvpA family protein [Clostridia bacterium]